MHIFEINSLTNYQTILLLLVISRAVTQELLKRKIICILLEKTSRMQKCIKYQGVKIWNDIPSEIQNSNSKNFKRKMKKHLLTLQS